MALYVLTAAPMGLKLAASVGLVVALGACAEAEETASRDDALGTCAEAVTTAGLNLRAAPTTDATVLRTMDPGTRVEVLEQRDDWAHVRVGQDQGWAKASFLECRPADRPSIFARHVDDQALVIDGEIEPAWAAAPAVTFDTAWSGTRTSTSTTVRVLWSERALCMLWELDGAGLNVDTTRPVSTERDKLYEEDCVEVFLAPNPAEPRRYFEIELGPMGHFFDLLVDRRSGTSDVGWSSNAEIRTTVGREQGKAVVEVALRSPEILAALRPNTKLPIGLFRLEGKAPRQFFAWIPTRTPRPNFHVPEAFGTLVLE